MNPTPIQDEATLLAVLDSEATLHDKAVACQRLVYVAGPKSVTPLAALLTHEHLSDYARSGLEAIDDPSSSQALLDALPKLKDRPLAGAAASLGVRRETKAIAALEKLAKDSASGAQTEAVTSLGQIGTPQTATFLGSFVAQSKEPLRSAVGHAALVAAEQLKSAGDDAARSALLKQLRTAFPKGPIHEAAAA